MSSNDLFSIFKQACLLLLTPKCFDTYFLEFNFLEKSCFAQTLSKGLGIAVILGSVLVKVPQILKIKQNKTAKGINLASVTLDLMAITIYSSYNYVKGFPFTAWGDAGFLGIQTLIVGFLILFYDDILLNAISFVVIYSAILWVLIGGITPLSILWTLQGLNIPILLTGKLVQAYTNYKNGGTGQLSAITCFMLFFGSLARIFTSIQETGDPMVIMTNFSSFCANTVIVLQICYYWNKKKVD